MGENKVIPEKSRKLRVSHILILLLLIAAGAFTFYRLNLKRKLHSRIADIRALGHPVTFEELNQWYSIPMNVENSAYFILDAVAYYNEPEDDKLLPVIGKAELPARTETMSEETKKIISQFLSDNQRCLELLHKTAGLECGRYPADFTLGMGIRLSHLNDMRNCALLLLLEVAHAAENENQDVVVQSIKSIFGIANSLNKEPAPVSQFVRIGYQGYAVLILEYVMNRITLTDEQLNELDKEYNKAQKHQGMLIAFLGERCMILDVLMRPHSEYFESDSALFFPPVLFLYKIIGLSDSEAIVFLDLADDIISAFGLPPHLRNEAAETIDEKIYEIPKTHILLRQFIPAFGNFIITDLKNIAKLRTAQVALAVQRFRLKNNNLPDSLNDLVPDYLESVPLDPFNGNEMRYKKLNPGFVIYSVGEDLSDDGGKEQPNNNNQEGSTTRDITFTVER